MKLLSELPKTDLTPFKIDNFVNGVTTQVCFAGLYLLRLATSEEYMEEVFNHDDINITETRRRYYDQLKDYYELNLDKPYEGRGPLLEIMTEFNYDKLAEHFRRGTTLLDLTGYTYDGYVPPIADIVLEESVYLKDYLSNKKAYGIPDNLELVLIQEYISKYQISDDNIYKLCQLVEVDNINKTFGLLKYSHLPSIDDMLAGNVNPNYTTMNAVDDDTWRVTKMLNTVLKHHIKRRQDDKAAK